MSHIIVIGAGQAGAALVAKLRALSYEGDITLIGAEPQIPYQRPPLSKAYLLGQMEEERLYLRPRDYYDAQNIRLITGETIAAVDAKNRTVMVGDETLTYDHLALTTGSEPRRLPKAIGGDLAGVHVVRTLADVDAMAPDLTTDKRVLIVGGGYIGLEAAAVTRKLGLSVTLIEMAERILQRVAASETSDFFRALHKGQGVDIRESTGLTRLIGEARVSRAELSDGTILDVDAVIVGVGITPAQGLAEKSGLTIENGIAVDDRGRTSDPAIWSAGDCASFPYQGRRIRLESVQNAIDQAEAVAANMLGADDAYVPNPWFWSDQFDIKLQIAGLNTGFDHIVTRPGSRPGTQSHWYYRDNALISIDAMSDPRSYMVGKRMIENGITPAPDQVADPEADLKALLK